MTSARTRILLAAATLVGGILAGGIIDRAFVGGPAWHQLGIDAWVQYSRHADLHTGFVLYPLVGIGATVLITAAAVSYYFDRSAPRSTMIPLLLAAAFSAAGLLFTVKAAPIMLSLGTAQPGEALRRAFDEFHFWGLYLRGASDTLAFIAEVYALAALSRKN
jgi:hypothetical protein